MDNFIYAKIHSLGGQVEKVRVVERNNIGTVTVVDYNGIKCTCIYNPFVGCYYADDLYGVVEK